MLTVCRTPFANINSHIQYCTLHASHKLTLSEWRSLKVQASHYTIRRHALVILHEVDSMTKN
jgi:hypothetical protein